MRRSSGFWFPAKRYGWGWGLPNCWQGWAVLCGFFILLGAGFLLIPPEKHALGFAAYATALAGIFAAICYVKGEPPKWHWGSK
jgi:hypothetical protein